MSELSDFCLCWRCEAQRRERAHLQAYLDSLPRDPTGQPERPSSKLHPLVQLDEHLRKLCE